jgi:hypothetical protein
LSRNPLHFQKPLFTVRTVAEEDAIGSEGGIGAESEADVLSDGQAAMPFHPDIAT